MIDNGLTISLTASLERFADAAGRALASLLAFREQIQRSAYRVKRGRGQRRNRRHRS